MDKSLKTLLLISVILAGTSILLTVALLTFLWEPACKLIGCSDYIVAEGAIFPIGSIVSIAGCLIVNIILLIISHKTKNALYLK